MTTRVNQDKLKRFFGLARNVCGSNDHPDSILFGDVFRLLCTYTSLKPLKGSNVSGGEMVHTLLQFSEQSSDDVSGPQKDEWSKILDGILEKEVDTGDNEHEEYLLKKIEMPAEKDIKYVVVYVAGYVLRKIEKRNNKKCEKCIDSIKANPEDHDNSLYSMINYLNKGALMYPSRKLIELLNCIEQEILIVMQTNRVTKDTLFRICYAVLDKNEWTQLVGCSKHEKEFTKSVISYFFILRMHFIAKRFNVENRAAQNESRKHRKLAKLQ